MQGQWPPLATTGSPPVSRERSSAPEAASISITDTGRAAVRGASAFTSAVPCTTKAMAPGVKGTGPDHVAHAPPPEARGGAEAPP